MTHRELPEWPKIAPPRTWPVVGDIGTWDGKQWRPFMDGPGESWLRICWESRCREAVEALKQAIECDTIGGAAGKCWNALSRIGPLPDEDKP